MPDIPITAIDSIERVPYRIGYSFRQPGLVKPVTRTRPRPYFAMNWSGSVDEKKAGLARSGVLQRYPSTWRRAAKGMAVAGLGVVGNRRELPDFSELGEAPGATDKDTTSSSVTRDVTGFLSNLITTAGGVMSQSQQLEIARARAQGPYANFLPNMYNPSGGLGMMGWLAIIGVAGAGAYFYMKRA